MIITVGRQHGRNGHDIARLIAREGAARAERFFSLWLPLEARYFSALDPAFHADAVIDTSNWTL